MWQGVAVCGCVLQQVATCWSMWQVLQCATVCCSALQRFVVCCSVLQYMAVCYSQGVTVKEKSISAKTPGEEQNCRGCDKTLQTRLLQPVAVRGHALQHVAGNVLQYVAVCCTLRKNSLLTK